MLSDIEIYELQLNGETIVTEELFKHMSGKEACEVHEWTDACTYADSRKVFYKYGYSLTVRYDGGSYTEYYITKE